MSDSYPSKASWTRRGLRIGAGLTTALVLLQAALAGSFLGGSTSARDLHGVLGESVVFGASLVVVVIAVVGWRRGQLTRNAAAVAVAGLVAVTTQVFIGFAGMVAVHVPLGVSIFGLYLVLAAAMPVSGEAASLAPHPDSESLTGPRTVA